MNVQSPHKWWSTLKSAVFGTSLSLPPLVNESGGLVCESVGKADLLSDKTLFPRLSVVFWRLGSFPPCWRQANVTPIPKGTPSFVANYRPISITSVLSKVFERLVSGGRFVECNGVLPTNQFANRKALGTCDSFLCMSHTLQSALESGQEARIVQIDFSAAFDRVNNHDILYRLCSAGIGGPVLSILTQFLSNR